MSLHNIIRQLHIFWNNLALGQLQQLGPWNYLLLALFVLIEGPIATLLGAIAASTGVLNPYLVFLSASAGNLTADTLWYLLGRTGRVEWLLHHGRWLGIRKEHLDRFVQDMHTHAVKVLLLAKLTASFAIPALIAAGMARVPWRRTFSVVFIGECIWTGSLVFLGYHFSSSLKRLEEGLQLIALAGFFLIILLLTHYFQDYLASHWLTSWLVGRNGTHSPDVDNKDKGAS